MSWKRQLATAVGVGLVFLVGGIATMSYKDDQHRREVERLDTRFTAARNHPPKGVNPELWNLVCMAGLHDSVVNCLVARKYVETDKVRQLADYLDATQGRDLESLGGAFGLMDYIETMTPYAKDYSGFADVRSQTELAYGLKPVPVPVRLPMK